MSAPAIEVKRYDVMTQALNTMTLRDSIYGRSSVRSYLPERIERQTVQSLLAAAVRAPTAMHKEPWQFLVVQDASTLNRLSERAKASLSADVTRLHAPGDHYATFSQLGFNIFYDAGTLIVICAPTSGTFEAADCWLAAENLMLTAHSMGLGSCVIGLSLLVLNLPEVKQELGIPAEMAAIAPIIVGKPRGNVQASLRNEPHVLGWR